MGSIWRMLALALMPLVIAGGCSDEGSKSKTLPLKGTVKKIDLVNSTVTLRVYREKQGQEVDVTGEVTEETEILINGVLAKLSDVRVGELAEGTVRVVKEGDTKRYVGVRFRIKRSEAIVAPGAKQKDEADDAGAKQKDVADETDAKQKDEADKTDG